MMILAAVQTCVIVVLFLLCTILMRSLRASNGALVDATAALDELVKMTKGGQAWPGNKDCI